MLSKVLDLNDHLLQAPDSLLATLLGNLFGEILLGLVGGLLGSALGRCSRFNGRLVLANRGSGNAFLVLI
jgi:purine-cytosine permease-like protein